MRYASTYGLESLVLAHQHETFAFQKKRQRRHGIFENFILKKSLKKPRTSFCFFYQFWQQIHKDMKLLYGLVAIWKIFSTFSSKHHHFHFYFPTTEFDRLVNKFPAQIWLIRFFDSNMPCACCYYWLGSKSGNDDVGK